MNQPRYRILALLLCACCMGLTPAQVSGQGATPPRATPTSATAPLDPERFDLTLVDAPAPQVFLAIVQGSSYQMLVSPDVTGRISVNLRKTNVMEALDAIKAMYGYSYQVQGNRILVYGNGTQTHIFRINYLPGRRGGESDTRVATSALSSSASNQGNPGNPANTGNTSGSGLRPVDSAQVRTTLDADFWAELRDTIGQMVGKEQGRSVIVNPSSGVVVVRAMASEIVLVERFLQTVQASVERQVMLEAKILEVSLSEESRSGINWAAFGRMVGNASAGVVIGAPGAVLSTTGTPLQAEGNSINTGERAAVNLGSLGQGFYGLAFQATNFAALLSFLESQGDVQVLSSPRIATLNNQKALLKVGSDEFYVSGISYTQGLSNSNGTSTPPVPKVDLVPLFSGIVLDVTPQIDAQGQVMLHIHPSISAVSERNKLLDLGQLGSYRLPLAASSINETDSVVRIADGQIVAIGGLMTQETQDNRSGLPGLSKLPVFGRLFGQTERISRKRELVILIKPTVIPSAAQWPAAPTVPAAPVPAQPATSP